MGKLLEHPGRRVNGTQSAASWIMDLVSTKKTLLFCAICASKFNPRRHGYRKMYVPDYTGKTDGYMANGRCDACKQMTISTGGGRAFITEETYQLTCIDPVDARRQARLKARSAATAWSFINQGSHRPAEAVVRRIR